MQAGRSKIALDLRVNSKVYTVYVTKTISRLAADFGLKPDTIRYYERIGLLPQPERTSANYRSYDSAAAERLRFIKGGQRLGLKLDEIRELLDIKDTGTCPCGHTATLLRKRIAALDEELARLSVLRSELAQMIDRWPEADNDPEGLRWHCAGEVIPLPEKIAEWVCAGDPGCRAVAETKTQTERR